MKQKMGYRPWKLKPTYLKLTIPIREIVAGDACIKSCVSKIKFTLSPKRMRQPDGNVNNLFLSKCMKQLYAVFIEIKQKNFQVKCVQLTCCHLKQNLAPKMRIK